MTGASIRIFSVSLALVVFAALPGPVRAGQRFVDAKGDGVCPRGYVLASPNFARAHQNQACRALGRWYIARLAGGGTMRGWGYGCKIRNFERRGVGDSLCVRIWVRQPAAAAERWAADSNTAMSITGDVQFAPDRITFANGQSLPLVLAGTAPRFLVSSKRPVSATIYRVTTPANPKLLNGNQLCGNGPTTFIALWNPAALSGASSPNREIDVFTGNQLPSGQSDANFCASYTYDLATAQPTAATATAGRLPWPAHSWGGVVRSGPGRNYRRLASLREGDPVIILARSAQQWNGYPWFKIRYHENLVGYQWGGVLCPIDTPVKGTFQVCH